MSDYVPAPDRYAEMRYRRCGQSGLRLPALSLGLWHNFGGDADFENARALVRRAFDLGITHFDLANNYGPPPGSAETTFGQILRRDLSAHRNEFIVSTKAGYAMWDGPYGDGGSRKYLLASLDQSLRRLGLDYVDIFYHHRPDPDTPLEESLTALVDAVRSGRALYAGVSNYPPDLTRRAAEFLRTQNVPLLIHQPRYHLLHREPETSGLFRVLDETGSGCIVFCPLAQGVLTNRYLAGIPADSRAAGHSAFLPANRVTPEVVEVARKLDTIAKTRGQSLAQMALAWTLRRGTVTSALIGASRPSQIEENVAALARADFFPEELAAIDAACGQVTFR